MTEPLTIAELRKNNRETLRVSLSQFKGHDLVSAWVFVPGKDGETLRPTKSGVSMSVKLLPDLRRAIEQAEAKALELGLLSAGSAAQ